MEGRCALSQSLCIFDEDFSDDTSACLLYDGEPLSFAETRRRAVRIRVRLKALLGERAEQCARVAYIAHGDADVHVLLLALVGMGAIAVPIHPKLTEDERQVLFEVARPDVFLAESELAHLVRDLSLDDDGAALAPPEPVDPEQTLAVVFTSGTTGRPKGARLSRRAFVASARASASVLAWEPHDRWFLCMPLAHVGGIGVVIRCLLARKAVVHFGRRAFDPNAALVAMDFTGATIASLVPTMLARFLEVGAPPPRALRHALLGGAAASPSQLQRGRDAGWPLVVTYGLTEACSHVTLGASTDTAHDVGRAIPGTEIRIADGQIAVRGQTLFSGYLGVDTSPFDADGFYRTGDLGELDMDGRLTIHARRTDLIVTGGENVYPREIEICIEDIPGVQSAAVFGIPDETWGQLVAMVVVVAQGGPTLEDISAVLKQRLARHKRPRRGAEVDALPTNALGKIIRTKLSELAPSLSALE
jgi:O-succinylbenzoic acid--CoA ligase